MVILNDMWHDQNISSMFKNIGNNFFDSYTWNLLFVIFVEIGQKDIILAEYDVIPEKDSRPRNSF